VEQFLGREEAYKIVAEATALYDNMKESLI